MTSNAKLRPIADLRNNPLAKGELREVKEGIFVSLRQSQSECPEYVFCLNPGGRTPAWLKTLMGRHECKNHEFSQLSFAPRLWIKSSPGGAKVRTRLSLHNAISILAYRTSFLPFNLEASYV
jgi:hypothetical protein